MHIIFFTQVYWLLCRQWLLVKGSVRGLAFNYVILWPIIWGVPRGYLIPNAFFAGDAVHKGTELLIGSILMQVFVVTWGMLVELLDERDESGILHYHITATSYAAMFVSRFSFYVLYVYAVVLPFFPALKVVLGSHFYTDQLSWMALSGMLFLISATTVSYMLCVFSFITSVSKIEIAWGYAIEPLLWLSGMWAPVYAIAKSGVPGMSWFLFFNPFAYATDSLRQLFFHDVRFSPLSECILAMSVATALFTLLSYWLLKRRLGTV